MSFLPFRSTKKRANSPLPGADMSADSKPAPTATLSSDQKDTKHENNTSDDKRDNKMSDGFSKDVPAGDDAKPFDRSSDPIDQNDDKNAAKDIPADMASSDPSAQQLDGNIAGTSNPKPQQPVKRSIMSSMFRSRTPSPIPQPSTSAIPSAAKNTGAVDQAVSNAMTNDPAPDAIPATQTVTTADSKLPSTGKGMFRRPPKADATDSAPPQSVKDQKKPGFLSSMFGSRSRSPSPNQQLDAPVAVPAQPNPNPDQNIDPSAVAPTQSSVQQPIPPQAAAATATSPPDTESKNVLPSITKASTQPDISTSGEAALKSPPKDMNALPIISPKQATGSSTGLAIDTTGKLASNENIEKIQRQNSPTVAAKVTAPSEKSLKPTIETTANQPATNINVGRPPRTPTRQSPKPSPKASAFDAPSSNNEVAQVSVATTKLSPKSPLPADGDHDSISSPFPQLISSVSPKKSPTNSNQSATVASDTQKLSPKNFALSTEVEITKPASKPPTPVRKPYTIDTLEETLSELYRRLRLIGGLVDNNIKKPSRNLHEEMVILFEGFEIQLRGKITGQADQEDFSEALNHLGVFDEKFGLQLREALIREIFSKYSQGVEYVDYELFVTQLLSEADPRLLLSNRSDDDIYDIFVSAMSGLFQMQMADMTPSKALGNFYIFQFDSSLDLLSFDSNTQENQARVLNDKDHLVSWFTKLILQAAPSLKPEETVRLYSLLSNCEPVDRTSMLEILTSADASNDQVAKRVLEHFQRKNQRSITNIFQSMSIVRQPSLKIQQQNKTIQPAVFAMDIIRAIQFDPIRPNRNQPKKSLSIDDDLYGSIHGARRKRALREGRVGGKPIMPKPTPDEAATKIESCWRSKRVRRKLRRKNIAASMIQEFVRRIQAKRKAKAQIARIQIYEKEERERMFRQARIWKQERELMILRQLPVENFLRYDKLKQQNSAKVIQRFWRGVVRESNDPSIIGSAIANRIMLRQSYSNRTKDDKLQEESVKLTQDLYNMMRSVREANKQSLVNLNESPSKEPKDEPMNALHLAALQRRIAEQARSKLSDHEEVRLRRGLRPMSSMNVDEEDEDDLMYAESTSKAQLRRRKYEELINLQNMSSIMLKEYVDEKPDRDQRVEARTQRMQHIEELLEELTHLPSLDSSPLSAWMTTMSEKESNPNDIKKAAYRHLQTVDAMRNLQSITGDDKSKYRRWSIVASPYDTLLPPVDITASPFQSSNDTITDLSAKNTRLWSGVQLADDWLAGKDAEESLWWVAYACQPPTYLGEGLLNPNYSDENDIDGENLATSSDKALVQKLLGSVNRHNLLDRLCRENILSSQRRERIQKIIKAEECRLQQKAEKYQRQVLTQQVLDKHRAVDEKPKAIKPRPTKKPEDSQLQSILSKPSTSRLSSGSKSVSIVTPKSENLLEESTDTISRDTIQTSSSIEIPLESYSAMTSTPKKSPERKRSPERKSDDMNNSYESSGGDISAIMARVFDRILDNRQLISKPIINEAISKEDITQFRKAFVYPIFVALINICGGVNPIVQYLSQASKTMAAPIDIDIHVVGIMIAELCIELNIIRPRASSPSASPGRSKRSPSRAQARESIWQMEIKQIGFFLRLLAAIETIHDVSSTSLPSPGGESDIQIPSIDIRGNFTAILQDLMMLHSSIAEDSLSHERCAALSQNLSISRSMISVKAYRNKATREQVLLSLLPSSLARLADSYDLSDDDLLGIFIRIADIRLSGEEIQYLRSHLLLPPANFGGLKELLCQVPATMHHRQLQIKLQIVLNAIPHLINDITAYFSQDSQSTTAQVNNRSYHRDIQHALWKSDCILSQAEIYSISYILDRARVVVGLDLGAALTRIKQGQFLAAILST